ncbi:UvrD-helicase domain-containing protein [Thalassolituus sp.]|uniref:UvrD-helicase domain-containing protein n=1 Tax=Thalassolituus sp. TaxID=2030822 RepID=UPI0035162513
MSAIDITVASRGHIVAPAGCGKTHLLTEALMTGSDRPRLVLTHTTAGVAAMKARLRKLNVPSKNYVVATIDGWALRFAKFFPNTCEFDFEDAPAPQFYPRLRAAVTAALSSEIFDEIVSASYSQLLVDEYQDCNDEQHRLICQLSRVIPSVVFGDPMQAIFTFSGRMPSWDREVGEAFPLIATLDTPWRWSLAENEELGTWILDNRTSLQEGRGLILDTTPACVQVIRLQDNSKYNDTAKADVIYGLMREHPTESIMAIAGPRDLRGRQEFGRRVRGLDVLDSVELTDAINAAQRIDRMTPENALKTVLEGLSKFVTNLETTATCQRVTTILSGTNRNPPTEFESISASFSIHPNRRNLYQLILAAERKPGTRVFRRAPFETLKEAASLGASEPTLSLVSIAKSVRDSWRHKGDSRISYRTVGSTLLLKGLECDHAVILNARDPDMTPQHLYVAISRASKSLTIFT